jgi:uncharacterized membrane protein YtjA (UPF0391 family)
LPSGKEDKPMQGAILTLILTIAVALVGFIGVPEPLEGVVQVAFFLLLVIFVILMVRYIARDR